MLGRWGDMMSRQRRQKTSGMKTQKDNEEDRKLTWRLGEELPRENTGRKDNIYFLKASEKQETNLKRGEK